MSAEQKPVLAAALFPPGVAVSWSAVPGNVAALPAVEQALTDSMAPARRDAFVQGRLCARHCMGQLGLPEVPLPVGEQRAPLWPPGVVGSISHCDGRALAAAARIEVAGGLGVDLELRAPLEPAVLELVCTPVERDWLAQAESGDAARLLFAAKESIYKCLWTRVRRFIDFQEVTVHIDIRSDTFSAEPADTLLDGDLLRNLNGRFQQLENFWVTGCYLPPSPML